MGRLNIVIGRRLCLAAFADYTFTEALQMPEMRLCDVAKDSGPICTTCSWPEKWVEA